MDNAQGTRVRWPRNVLIVLAVLNSVAALGGAWGLAAGFLDLGQALNDRLPWGSTVVAGLAPGDVHTSAGGTP